MRQQVDPRYILPAQHPLTLQRQAACRACPLSGFKVGLIGAVAGAIGERLLGEKLRQCGACKCFVYVKSRIVVERCPKGFW